MRQPLPGGGGDTRPDNSNGRLIHKPRIALHPHQTWRMFGLIQQGGVVRIPTQDQSGPETFPQIHLALGDLKRGNRDRLDARRGAETRQVI